MPDDNGKPKDNVVHLGTGDLVAIGKALRDMYDFYLHAKPPDRIERLLTMIDQRSEPPQSAAPEEGARPSARDDVTPR
jgi:hypothetical protein